MRCRLLRVVSSLRQQARCHIMGYVVLCAWALIGLVAGYPSGAPTGRCESMRPGHGSPSTSPSPFRLDIAQVQGYTPGRSVQVTIRGQGFAGLLLQARRRDSTQIVGTWSSPPANTKLLQCSSGVNSAITHSNTALKEDGTSFTWNPPSADMGQIEFVATILQARFVYWMNHKSAILSYTGGASTLRSTRAGQVEGRLRVPPQGSPEVEEYLGVPYAEPPVGQLRYAQPVSLSRLPNDPYMATDYKYSCPFVQDTVFGSFEGFDMWNPKNPQREDCLFLNVWVPTPKRQKRAVMVFIYGGGFYSGTSALWIYDGKALAAHSDVIIVSFNYRVGSLGFLSTGDGKIKGNYGLWDCIMALEWVRDNIEAFGGDRERITLFGESAGAAIVGYLLLIERSRNLFHRAILQSGAPQAPWGFMFPDWAVRRSKTFFEAIGCNYDESESDILSCLRSRNVEDIINNDWVRSGYLALSWVPNIDGELITNSSYMLMRNHKMANKDLLLGTNANEATFWLVYAIDALSKDHESRITYDEYIEAINVIHWDLEEKTRERIAQMYAPPPGTQDMAAAYRDALDLVSGDASFTCPTWEMADAMSANGARVYGYQLNYRASNEVWPEWMGVIHGADLQWVFGMPLNRSRGYTDEEVAFSKNVMDYWSNFAKSGSPNSATNLPFWPRYEWKFRGQLYFNDYLSLSGAPDDLDIRLGRIRMNPYCAFWNEVTDLKWTAGESRRKKRR